MKRHWLKSLLILSVLFLVGAPAWADIDHRCLSTCMNSGNSSATCMPECSYGLAHVQPRSIPGTTIPENHKVLSAPVPVGDLVLPAPSVSKTGVSGKDYTCITQCLQNGMRYQLCEQRCTKTNCGPGTSRCKDVTGAASGAPMLPPTGK